MILEVVKSLVSGAGLHASQLLSVRNFIHANLSSEERRELFDFLMSFSKRISERHSTLSNHNPAACVICGMTGGLQNTDLQSRIKQWLAAEGKPS